MSSKIEENIALIKANIVATCKKAGRNPSEVSFVAVSKTVGATEVAAAIAAGVHDFGENRTTLFAEKQTQFPDERWHFIGSIQTNKIKNFVGKAALVHSVASKRALLGIDNRGTLLDVCQPILIEVNTSGEASKDGIAPTELDELLQIASAQKNIRVDGLMTMAPANDIKRTRKAFEDLRNLRDKYIALYAGVSNIALSELSMGMSDDYAIAIEEGATIVRIGRNVWL